jgi:hypothetical protein
MVHTAHTSRVPLYVFVAVTSCTATAIGAAFTSFMVLALTDSNPILNLYREIPDAAPVSGWYGPGAWLPFLVSLCLAYWRTLQPPHEPVAPERDNKLKARSWDGDLLVALVYISVAVGDLLRQCAVLMHSNPPTVANKVLPPLAAAATVVHLTFGLTIVPLLICCIRAAYQTVTSRDITLISAQYAVVWFLVLCLNVTAMGVFEYTLGRHHAFGGVKDDGVDSIFGKKDILFTIRLGFLPPEWIQKHFGQWKYVAVAPILLVAAFVLGRALWILARDPSTTATKQHRQRIRESCIMLMVQRSTIFIFAVFVCIVFPRPLWNWLVLAVWGMCLPGSVFAPGSGIHLAELDQIGTLTTVLLVQMLRALFFLHQKVMERRMSCVATAVDEENLKAAAE